MNDLTNLWDGVMAEVQSSTSKNNFMTWFKGTRIIKIDEGVVHLAVPSPFAYEWLSSKCHNETLRALRKMNEHVRALEYIIVDDSKKKAEESRKTEPVAPTPTISMPLQDFYVNKEDNLNSRYIF